MNITIPKNDSFCGTIAVLHTTAATLPMMKKNILDALPNAKIINFVDDSILGLIAQDERNLTYCLEKVLCYAQFAERQHVDIIINACSTIGAFSTYATGKLHTPLIRIDDAVTNAVCDNANHIAILATAKTTLTPSTDLVNSKVSENAKVDTLWLEEAALLNASGDKISHDKYIAAKINAIADEYDSIFLAQASMADSLEYVDQNKKAKVYTSIPYAIRQLVNTVSSLKHK
ncbi:MAG: hypothetical protein KHZ62_06480 [Clostridiales bacterium]|nr:hypothetical protein [Clostridiales bacterium]